MKLYYFLIKCMICVSLFLGFGIVCRINDSYKLIIYNALYQEYFDFSSMKYFYNKYLGGIFPIANVYNGGVSSVFREDLVYRNVTSYLDGVKLSVDYNYLVPILESGVVVYSGDKEGYGEVVIVEGDNGVDIWYGNLSDVMVNIYDVVDKGSYLGSVNGDSLYLVYSKGNKFLDYNNYLY